jgi:ACT domain
VSSTVRLRVELADRPGSLADLAMVIAGRRGNITAIDVLEGEGGLVIDEITVEVPDDLDLSLLRSEIVSLAKARVLSHQRAVVVDPIVRVLRRMGEAVERVPADPAEALRLGLADLCATPAVWVFDGEAASAYAMGRHALEQPGTAILSRTTEKLPSLGETVSGEASVVAVGTLASGRPCVAMVARSVTQGFTPTECQRIEALVALHARLEAVTARV